MKFNFKEGLKHGLISILIIPSIILLSGFLIWDIKGIVEIIGSYFLIRVEVIIFFITFLLGGIVFGSKNNGK